VNTLHKGDDDDDDGGDDDDDNNNNNNNNMSPPARRATHSIQGQDPVWIKEEQIFVPKRLITT
jgi:hypothetical protein